MPKTPKELKKDAKEREAAEAAAKAARRKSSNYARPFGDRMKGETDYGQAEKPRPTAVRRRDSRSTKNGRIKRAHAYTSHILTKKTTKRKRGLRMGAYAGRDQRGHRPQDDPLQIRNLLTLTIGGN